MKIKIKSLLVAVTLLLAVSSRAQTNTTPSWITTFYGNAKTFLTDNTNIFNAHAVQVEAGPFLNLSSYKVGADLDVQFPIAQQATVGFDVLYYDGKVYDGTFNTTIGKTWTVPLINQPVYTYAQLGVGTDLQSVQTVIDEEWVGVKWQYVITTNLKTGVNAAYGRISNTSGTLAKLMATLEWDF